MNTKNSTLIIGMVLILFLSLLIPGCSNNLVKEIEKDLENLKPQIVIKQGTVVIDTDLGNIDFSEVEIGESQEVTFTIENTGGSDLILTGTPMIEISLPEIFSIIQETPSKIVPGGIAQFTIRFSPLEGKLYTTDVTIRSNDALLGVIVFRISGTGKETPEIKVKQGSDYESSVYVSTSGFNDLGYATVNTTKDFIFFIENTGAEDLVLTATPFVELTGTGFVIISQPSSGTIQSGEYEEFSIRFTPLNETMTIGTITIASNVSGGDFTCSISAGGSNSEIDISCDSSPVPIEDEKDFGDIVVESASAPMTFKIRNTTSGSLILTGEPAVQLSGTNPTLFTVQAQPSTEINGSSSVFFDVIFTPDSIGEKSAVISIPNNDADENPYYFTIKGTGLNSDIGINQDGTEIESGTGLFNFDDVVVTESGSPVTFTIANTGNIPLNLTGTPLIEISGTDSSMFSVESVPQTGISSGNSSSFSLSFSPSIPGAKTATITINNNDVNESPFTFTVAGNGITPGINIKQGTTLLSNGGAFSFPDTLVESYSEEITFTIINNGTSTLNLTGSPIIDISGTDSFMFNWLTDPSDSIAPGTETTFRFKFYPLTTGEKTVEISIANDDVSNNPYVITFTGTGITPEINILDPDSNTLVKGTGEYIFQAVPLGSSSPTKVFTIQNLGTSTLNLTNIPVAEISGGDSDSFSIDSYPADTIASGEETTFGISFIPAGWGLQEVSVRIYSDDLDEFSYSFIISGTGLRPDIDVTDTSFSTYSRNQTYNIDDVTAGASSPPITILIENEGDADLLLTGPAPVSIIGDDSTHFITEQPLVYTLAPTGTTSFVVYFTPQIIGTFTGTVSIVSNDPSKSPYQFHLEGTGTGALYRLQQNTTVITQDDDFGFGSVTSGNSSSATFTIYNDGNIPLTLLGAEPWVTIGGTDADAFSLTAVPSSSINAGMSTSFDIDFNPNHSGGHSAAVSFFSNDLSQPPISFTLSGTGLIPDIYITDADSNIIDSGTGSFTFPVIDFTELSDHEFTIHNDAVVTGTLYLSGTPEVELTGDSQFYISTFPSGTTILPGGTETFTCRFDPITFGLITATISIENNTPGESPYTFDLAGTASSSVRLIAGANEHFALLGDYLLGDGSGMVIFDVSDSASPSMEYSVGGTTGQGIAIYEYGSADYAYIGDSTNIKIYDITTMTSPSHLSNITARGTVVDIEIFSQKLYAALGSQGLEVWDLSSGPEPGPRAGLVSESENFLDLSVSESYIFAADSGNGLKIINRSSLVLTGSYDTSPTSAFKVKHYSGYAYVLTDEPSLLIIDYTTPSSPSLAATFTENIHAVYGIEVAGSYVYLTGQTLDYQGVIFKINITDPTAPELERTYITGSEPRAPLAGGSNLYYADGNSLMIIEP